MNPTITQFLWTVLSTILLVWLISLLIKYFRRKGRGRSTVPVLLAGVVLVASSCSKAPVADGRLNFRSLDEAREYYRIPDHTPDYSLVKRDTIIANVAYREPAVEPHGDPIPPGGVVTLTEVFITSGHSVTFTWVVLPSGVKGIGGGALSASGFSSGLVGLTAGVTWKHTTGTYWNYPNSSLIYFQVAGEQYYNVFVNGIGNVLTQGVILQGIYNTKTKTYTLDSYTAGRQPPLN